MKKILLISFLSLSSSLFTLCDGQYKILLNFNWNNGANPQGQLTLAGRKLYGIAQGGILNGGCIFSIDTDGSNYKDMRDFPFVTSLCPTLVLSGKTLYGTTEGTNSSPAYIFSIDTDGNNFKYLYNSYDDSIFIANFSSLTIVSSKLYGMATGGKYLFGCIFSIDTTGNNFKDVFDFTEITGRASYGFNILTFYNNRLYGMMPAGGAYDSGCIFSIDTSGSAYKKILDFNATNGKNPYNNVILSGNRIYGATTIGGTYDLGCIFSIDTNGNGYKKLFDFNITNGADPEGSLVLSKGVLYGTAASGGTTDSGLIFAIDTNGSGHKTLLEFNGPNGEEPTGSLTMNKNVLYGMTEEGGSSGLGTVFKIDTDAIAGISNLSTTTASINIYPNPSNGLFTLSHAELVSASQPILEVYNILGEKIYNATLKQVQGDNSVNLSDQPNGVYLYRVIANSGELIGEGKLIIQK